MSSAVARKVTLKEDDVKRLAQAMQNAAAALRELERLLVEVAPLNAMKAEKMAEEYEAAAKEIAAGRVAKAEVA